MISNELFSHYENNEKLQTFVNDACDINLRGYLRGWVI